MDVENGHRTSENIGHEFGLGQTSKFKIESYVPLSSRMGFVLGISTQA